MPMQSENGPLILGGQGAVLVTPRGHPIPPDDVVRELAKIDADLRIRWIDSPFPEGSAFCIERKWRRGDPRWKEVQEGRYSPDSAFDTEGRFPRDARTGDFIAWIRRNYGERAYAADPAKEAQRITDERFKRAKEAEEDAIRRTVEQGTERTMGETDHQRLVRGGFEKAHPMVHGFAVADGPKRLIPVPSVAEVVTDA